ncbi:MAG TPA: biotin transporter BioY [Chloroflexota bacterium]|nr:biotin transporter BioY [Chloroflexota bacterium]
MDPHIPTLSITGIRRPGLISLILREVALVLAATLFLALTARIRVMLPFTPVPITGQTLGVLLVGALYGPRRGTLAVLAYLAEGALGLPVFAGGAGGALVFAGPTGGYLAGFVPAAALAGLMAGANKRAWRRVTGMVVASASVYVFGVGWLVTLGTPLDRAVAVGMLPFLLGDVIKSGLAAGVMPAGAAIFDRFGIRPR